MTYRKRHGLIFLRLSLSSVVGFTLAVTLSGTTCNAALVYSAEFETPGDTESWAASAHADSFGQATASTGEGVLRFQQDSQPLVSNDPQLSVAFGTPLTLSPGQAWSTIEIRARQLVNVPGTPDAPGGPQPFSLPGTAQVYFTDEGDFAFEPGPAGGFAATNVTQVTGTGGWSVFTFDLAQALADTNRSDDVAINRFRFDLIGNSANAGKWAELDYFRVSAVPEPANGLLLTLLALRVGVGRRGRGSDWQDVQ